MFCLFKRKEKVIDPIIHDEESNFTLSNGVHILNKCENVTLTGNAIVLESFDCSFKEISGKAKIQMIENGTIDIVTGKAKIGLFKSGKIIEVAGKSSITTINTGIIDYVKDKASIGTMNGGFIRFVDDKAELATITEGRIMFVRNKARIVTMITGSITGILDNAQLVSMLNGKVTYLLNDARVGTMNNGEIELFADNSEVSTLNKGQVKEMLGKSVISANIEGEIGYQDKQTIILYSPNESAKRMNEYKQEKAELEARAKNIEKTEETCDGNNEEVKDTSLQEKDNSVALEKPRRKVKGKQMKLEEIATETNIQKEEVKK